jgi:hypothetical protein
MRKHFHGMELSPSFFTLFYEHFHAVWDSVLKERLRVTLLNNLQFVIGGNDIIKKK